MQTWMNPLNKRDPGFKGSARINGSQLITCPNKSLIESTWF